MGLQWGRPRVRSPRMTGNGVLSRTIDDTCVSEALIYAGRVPIVTGDRSVTPEARRYGLLALQNPTAWHVF